MSLNAIAKGIRALTRYTTDILHRKLKELQQGYVVHAANNVPDGESLNLYLKNPTADRTIDVVDISYVADVSGRFRIHDRVSDVSGGSDLTIENMALDEDNGSPDSGNMTAKSDVNFTADGTHLELPTTTHSGNATSPGEDNGTTPMIEPGRKIVIEVDDTSLNGGDVGIAVEYRELDRVPSRNKSAIENVQI